MIPGTLSVPNPELLQPVWKTVFDWIQQHSAEPDGEYEIRGRDIYASVQTVSTVSREEGTFEAHRKYIDVHVCIDGGEVIEWVPVDSLVLKMEFDTENDYGLYASPTNAKRVTCTPETYAIFFPADAHMPKLSDGTHKTCKKIVVKVSKDLLQ